MIEEAEFDFDICARKHGGNKESIAANPQPSRKNTDRWMILNMLKTIGPLTVDEVAEQWSTTPNAVSGRFTELKKLGLITKIGTRPTRSGCSAGVYQVLP